MNKIKVFFLLVLIIGASGWAFVSYREQKTGGSANNGYTNEFGRESWGEGEGRDRRDRRDRGPQLTDAQREEMRQARENRDYQKMRELMEASITPEQRARMEERREQMRARMEERRKKTEAILGPEQSEQLREKFRQRFSQRRGGGGFRGRGGDRGGSR
jgi:hypothetical protein